VEYAWLLWEEETWCDEINNEFILFELESVMAQPGGT
jgi:hypothetical protein